MFSPIRPINLVRTASTVSPSSGNAAKAVTSAGLLLATSLAQLSVNAKKSSFFDTKSVSQLTSIKAPVVPLIKAATTPSAVTREAALLALLPNFTRRISSALAMSPSASVNAFLHSIIGASVLARKSPTIAAVIAAITQPSLLQRTLLRLL